VTRAQAPSTVRSILVAVDGSPSSRRAVRLAVEIAAAFRARLTLLHVSAVPQFPTLIAEVDEPRENDEAQLVLGEEAKVARSRGVEPLVHRRRGRAAPQILAYASAHSPDLIVMGTRGLTGAKSVLLGSVSRAVSTRAKAQVVLVR
jgi:nucleotide-binding universal stress UspA family protein